MELSKNFTLEEMCESQRAKEHGIVNQVTDTEHLNNLKALCTKVLQPLRDEWGSPIRVTSGYRRPQLNTLLKGAATSQHCFDDMTEILTDNGWKSNETISLDDKVFTYNFGTSKIELKPINEIIRRQFNGHLYRISGKQIDIVCTDKHNVIVKYDSNKYKRRGCQKISPKGQAYFDSLKTDNDKWHLEKMQDVVGKRRQFMTCGYSTEKPNYDVEFMRFIMAVVSDGYFGSHCGVTPFIGFHVKKERKITYLCNLMDELEIRYSLRRHKDGTVYFYIGKKYAEKALGIIGKGKNLPTYILKADSDTLRRLIDTYIFFDGHKDKRQNNIGMSIVTVNSHNASILQAMCVLSGMRCVLGSREGICGTILGKKVKKAQRVYCLSICPDLTSSKMGEKSSEIVDYNGEVWCIRDDNDTVIIRRNGRVSIQGNCKGEAADLDVGEKSDNLKLFELAANSDLPFDQLINEFDGEWVHISHKNGGTQRGQILESKRGANGKTYYTDITKKYR